MTSKYLKPKKKKSISGYGIIVDGIRNLLPWEEAINSALGFCDEFIIVDGGSTDGTYERLQEMSQDDSRIKVHQNEWDFDEPTMFGIQKTKARTYCKGDYCFQMDMDEVVHENDYDKFHKVLDENPDPFIFTFGCITFYGGLNAMALGGENAWKWRLTKNVDWIVHGVVDWARKTLPNGKLYMNKQESDACEYIHRDSFRLIDSMHEDKLVVDKEVYKYAGLAKQNPRQYASIYAQTLNKLMREGITIYHYSWASFDRKIILNGQFWDRMWLNFDGNQSRMEESRWVKDALRGTVQDEQNIQYIQKLYINPVVYLDVPSQPAIMKEYINKMSLCDR